MRDIKGMDVEVLIRFTPKNVWFQESVGWQRQGRCEGNCGRERGRSIEMSTIPQSVTGTQDTQPPEWIHHRMKAQKSA